MASNSLDESAKDVLEFIPANGKINPGQDQKIIIRIRPGSPEFLKVAFTVQIGHFDPVIIWCYCQAIFPTVVPSLPRSNKIGPNGEIIEPTLGLQNSRAMMIICINISFNFILYYRVLSAIICICHILFYILLHTHPLFTQLVTMFFILLLPMHLTFQCFVYGTAYIVFTVCINFLISHMFIFRLIHNNCS